jgi:D-serine deaminase-like pyridoxal phosphate-dependent protein
MRLDLDRVETPAGVVDRARMERNADRVARYCAQHGLHWRPHVKTHKSRRVAGIQLAAGARGLTVATLHEAEVMSAVTDDLLLAYPPVGAARLERLLGLPSSVDVKVALDSVDVLEPLARGAKTAGRSVGVLVEIDVGLRRVGVQGVEAAVALAEAVAVAEGVRFEGLLFYAGHIRGSGPDEDRAMKALSADLSAVIGALSTAGLEPAVVSGGTTPTLWRSHEIEGLTEVRAGTCIFNDRDAVAVGAAQADDLAYTVLSTVISTAVEGRVAIDAGSKALAKEPRGGAGTFGVLRDHPEVVVAALSEEHGILDVSNTDWSPSVGDRVHVVPNHVCVSVNLQDRLLVRDGADLEAWPLEGRGRLGTGA